MIISFHSEVASWTKNSKNEGTALRGGERERERGLLENDQPEPNVLVLNHFIVPNSEPLPPKHRERDPMTCDNLPSSHVVQVVLHKPANGRELFVSARETFWHSRYVEPVGREGGYKKRINRVVKKGEEGKEKKKKKKNRSSSRRRGRGRG